MRRILPAVLAGLAFTACDLPTSLPSWDVDVQTPAITDTISLASALPAQVQLSGGAFVLPSWTIRDSIRMADVCGGCSSIGSLVVPAMTLSREIQLPLPADLVSATLRDGSVDVTVEHTLPFALLRSARGETGVISIEVRDSFGAVLARGQIDGATEALPPGSSRALTMRLAGATLSGPVTAHVSIQMPGSGEPVQLKPNMWVKVSAALHDVRMEQITARQAGVSLAGSMAPLAIGNEIRQQLLSRARSARVTGSIEYPLDAGADASVTLVTSPSEAFDSPGALKLVMPLRRGSNPFAVTVDSAQLAHLLTGDAVYARYQGAMHPGPVTLHPTDVIVYHLSLSASVEVGHTP